MPYECQQILDRLHEKNMGRTVQQIKSLLNQIFDCAIRHCLVDKNPLEIVVLEAHTSKHGKSLTKEEEQQLLSDVKDPRFKLYFALGLYTGLRPNEAYHVKREGKFIVTINSKRKNGEIQYKRIPIIPALEPYIKDADLSDIPTVKYLRQEMKKLLPNHFLYDLRTTFYSRCKEYGVADAARDEYVGHSSGRLGDTYTDLSDEYLLKEAEKLSE